MRAGLEVADVFRRHGDAYRHAHDGHLGRVERRVMSAIELCRTAALGGHIEAAPDCGFVRCAYNSCRNRHCPKCQGQARAEWLAARQAELLPVPYFHVVFTLPAPVAEIAFQNKATVYAILFRAAAETLRTIAADPEASGRRDRRLRRAPYLGTEPAPSSAPPLRRAGRRPSSFIFFSTGATRWVACRPGFFLPVRVFRRFRRLPRPSCERPSRPVISAFSANSRPCGPPPSLGASRDSSGRLGRLCQAALRRPEQVLAYLGRYTHRVAIANSRLIRLTGRPTSTSAGRIIVTTASRRS